MTETDDKKLNQIRIIKRLELIRSLIMIEEEQEVASHVVKLMELQLTHELRNILDLLAYGQARGSNPNKKICRHCFHRKF